MEMLLIEENGATTRETPTPALGNMARKKKKIRSNDLKAFLLQIDEEDNKNGLIVKKTDLKQGYRRLSRKKGKIESLLRKKESRYINQTTGRR
ncbi:hypothetical protein ANCDUO_23440 [Ancylostoma duodenale]|uniref:Uncharacterized protein n=1 Tax=Ancylostoma duodenale TaxID=51022 RepID=A0A0C2C9M1_9BILA|nr:hypothetical protein ANCDUO_23440 [Ancylostoma duodenale]